MKPRIVAFSRMFSRPVSSGWNPAPTSSSAETLPLTCHLPRCRPVDAREYLQRGGLAGTVVADDAEGPTLGHGEGGILQRPEVLLLGRARPRRRCRSLSDVRPLREDREPLGETDCLNRLGRSHDFTHVATPAPVDQPGHEGQPRKV